MPSKNHNPLQIKFLSAAVKSVTKGVRAVDNGIKRTPVVGTVEKGVFGVIKTANKALNEVPILGRAKKAVTRTASKAIGYVPVAANVQKGITDGMKKKKRRTTKKTTTKKTTKK